MSQYRPKHFIIEELVPELVFTECDNPEVLWNIFDDRILLAADLIREQYGPMTINNWKWGGARQLSGYRPFDCKTGAKWSQHKFGRGLDLIPRDVPAEKIREGILLNEAAAGLVSCVEMDISWLHIDCRMPHRAILKIYPR